MPEIAFTVHNQSVSGTLIEPEKCNDLNPAVLMIHGLGSSEKNYIPIAKKLAENGIVGMTVNLRGHGESQGDYNSLTVRDEFEDALDAYEYLIRHPFIDKKRIGILGASLGGALAAMIAGKFSVKSLVLRAPSIYTEEDLNIKYSEFEGIRDRFFKRDIPYTDYVATQSIQKFEGSLLIIESEKDEIIPHSIIQAYLDPAKNAKEKKLITLKNAGHQLSENDRPTFIKESISWFKKTL